MFQPKDLLLFTRVEEIYHPAFSRNMVINETLAEFLHL